MRLSPQSPEYRALHARALMALGYRQAAINALETPQSDEDRELLAALNCGFNRWMQHSSCLRSL